MGRLEAADVCSIKPDLQRIPACQCSGPAGALGTALCPRCQVKEQGAGG